MVRDSGESLLLVINDILLDFPKSGGWNSLDLDHNWNLHCAKTWGIR